MVALCLVFQWHGFPMVFYFEQNSGHFVQNHWKSDRISNASVIESGSYREGGTWGTCPRRSNKGAQNQGFELMNLPVFKLEI